MPDGYLTGVDFPATKEHLIDAAIEADAPQDLVDRLQQLSQEQYESSEELGAELSQQL